METEANKDGVQLEMQPEVQRLPRIHKALGSSPTLQRENRHNPNLLFKVVNFS